MYMLPDPGNTEKTGPYQDPSIDLAEYLLPEALLNHPQAEMDAYLALDRATDTYFGEGALRQISDMERGKIAGIRAVLDLSRYRKLQGLLTEPLDSAVDGFLTAAEAFEAAGERESYIKSAPGAAIALRIAGGHASKKTKQGLIIARKAGEFAKQLDDPELTKLAKRADRLAHAYAMPKIFQGMAIGLALRHEYPNSEW